MGNKICCIFNLAPLYDAPIYKLMDQELNCDFFIGDRVSSEIKLMNYNELEGFKKVLKYKPIAGKFYWQRGALNLAFKSYGHYIIIGEPYIASSWFVLLVNRMLRKKTYSWTHGWYGDETIVKKIIKKIYFGLANKVLVYGDYARNLMIREGFKAKKIVSIYNSLDFDTQCKIRDKLKLTGIYSDHFHNELPVLLYIGRIQKSKKIELLIQALKILQNKGITCNLIIIGKEVEETNLKDLVSERKLDNYVWFFGPCYEESTLGELIYNADVCISPGNVGLTAIHSLVYGTPVITHNNFSNQGPEFEAIEKGRSGDFFEENVVNDLCDKISSWISLSFNERERVRQNCFSIVSKKYNPHVQIEILKEVLT